MNEINNIKLWNAVLDKIENNDLQQFLINSRISEIKDEQIFIVVKSKTIQQILTTEYYNDLNETVNNILNSQLLIQKKFKINIITEEQVILNNPQEKKMLKLFEDTSLNPEYTFDNFIIGDFNKDAYKAASLIIKNKIPQFNPLFIYSESGLGKTHLLNAIGNEIKKNDKNKNILYTSANDFFNEYIQIVKGNREEYQITEYFKKIDVLLIDDIQFCSKKPKFQELFFNVFSSLLNKNKPVIIASDRHPEEIIDLENRLMTRFLGGLTIAITKPDFDSNIKIIKSYIKDYVKNDNNSNKDQLINKKLFSLIAEKYSKNIRELKGAVNHFVFLGQEFFYNNLNNEQKQIINSDFLIENNNKLKNEIAKITKAIEKYFSINDLKTLSNKKKNKNIILIEHIRIFLIKSNLNIPLKTISLAINRKYTTVFQAFKNIKIKITKDQNLKKIINNLENDLLNKKINNENETYYANDDFQKTYDKIKKFIPNLKEKKISETFLCNEFHISKKMLKKCIKYFNIQEFKKIN